MPVDAHLVKQGFAVNGIDASPRMIELARKNVPQGFYEVKDMFDLKEGEYCVDGVVSLRAMLHIPREKYWSLLETFASFMPNRGALLLSVMPLGGGETDADVQGVPRLERRDQAHTNAELIENAGFTTILNGIDGRGDEKRQIILARS